LSYEFGNDFISISDDKGNAFVLEHLDTIEIDDTFYLAFFPTDIDESDERYGLLILRAVDVNGEEVLESIDENEELLKRVHNIFVERLSNDEEDDDFYDNGN